MESMVWLGVIIGITICFLLILYVGSSLGRRIDRLSNSTNSGLDLKVDESTYRISHEYERQMFDNMTVVVKELRDDNSEEHKAIMIELKRLGE